MSKKNGLRDPSSSGTGIQFLQDLARLWLSADPAVDVRQCRRAIDRLRLLSLYDNKQVGQAVERLVKIESTIKRIRLSKSIIFVAAQTMPTIVKTLDAFHLVSAVAIRDRRGVDLLFATHDAQQATAARALGFTCIES